MNHQQVDGEVGEQARESDEGLRAEGAGCRVEN